MLTNKDLQTIIKAFEQLLDNRFDRLNRKLEAMSTHSEEYHKDLKIIKNKLDRFIAILNRCSKKQAILEKKLEAIEDYFDPPQN